MNSIGPNVIRCPLENSYDEKKIESFCQIQFLRISFPIVKVV